MFIGGYISAAGLGLSCPDWPLCPSGILPNEKYFLEWTHRLIAAITGVLVVALGLDDAGWDDYLEGRESMDLIKTARPQGINLNVSDTGRLDGCFDHTGNRRR